MKTPRLICLLSLWLGFAQWGIANTLFPGFIIDQKWLLAHWDVPKLVILDVRSKTEYDLGHIDKAVNLPVSVTFHRPPRDDLRAPLSDLRKHFGVAGIDNQSHIVIYDGGSTIDAARMVWVFQSAGHAQVALLNGGFPAWNEAQRATTTEPFIAQKKQFIPSASPDHYATKLGTRLAINNKRVMIIDARSEAEYQGLSSKGARFGHIPNAINVPFNLNFTKKNNIVYLKKTDELRKIYQMMGKDRAAITYCNRGKQSALTYLILRDLGYEAKAYDGSWHEWSQDPTLPVISPAPPFEKP